jgi:predicted acylesterase/phospholipase RssA
MTIKNIVINGGGYAIFNFYGAIKEANLRGLWKYEDIECFFGTSSGAMLCLILSLDYSWEDIDNFIINRPWNHIFKFNIINIFDYYTNNGILDVNFIYDIFTPLLLGKDIEPTVTMMEFYALTNKALYFYATDLNTFEIIELSHETYPNMKLLDCIYASSCLPVLCRPLKIENTYLMDGMFCNYPITKCFGKNKLMEETLGIINNNVYLSSKEDFGSMNVTSYLSSIINKLIINYQKYDTELCKPKYEFKVTLYSNDIYEIFNATSNPEIRKKLIEDGKKDATEYINLIFESHNEQIVQDSRE